MDLLNIPHILHDNTVKKAFPITDTYPKCSFKYSRTLGSIVYNYSNFSKNIDVNNMDEYPWSCDTSAFKDQTLGHVVTGSLDILADEDIKNIFKFGSKFRLIPEFNVEIVKKDIKTGVNDYIHKMDFKLKLPLEYFSEWKGIKEI